MKKTLILNVFAGIVLATTIASAQNIDSIFVRNNYDKHEYQIPMRDGIMLYTIVYTPKDQSRTYPIMMKRTCYSISTFYQKEIEKEFFTYYLKGEGNMSLPEAYMFDTGLKNDPDTQHMVSVH